jgi:phage FluMu gp28-like protein
MRHFLPYQLSWIEAEGPLHAQGRPAFALAEKSVRIGWTYADAFKNVRKRLRFMKRDYLFATKDYPSALEYMRLCYTFAGLFDRSRSILSHGEEYLQLPRLDSAGRPTGFTDELKVGLIKFDNGSRILAFSSNPRAMAVYAGDVGLDEFAKHPNARLLWETAQARVTWGYDMAVWSSHDGEDTLFNEFARAARAGSQPSTLNSQPFWNLYFRVTLPDAIQSGLLDTINRVQGTAFTSEQFIADCRARAGSEEIFQQSYLCNPMGAASASIVDWSAIERCRADYSIERVHLEDAEILSRFGPFASGSESSRASRIHRFLQDSFPDLFTPHSGSQPSTRNPQLRLGFDVAASGQGDLAAIYIDEVLPDQKLSLRALFTCRTEDWHFLKTVLFFFLGNLRRLQAAGDESGLGRQICWEAAQKFAGRFLKVNFSSAKHDLGFTLMNQLSTAAKRFPASQQDIAADFFALRKIHNGTRWVFTEGRNDLNLSSHCDIAWAAALASHAHTHARASVGAAVACENGWFDGRTYHPYKSDLKEPNPAERERQLLQSDDPSIWRPLGS